MLDRPAIETTQSGSARRTDPRWPFAFVGLSGLLGAGGVAVGAAGAHVGGGDLARTSSEFLMVHAAAVLAGSGAALALGRTPARPAAALLASALSLLTAGAALFGGELAAAALLGWRPLPLAAPTGGLCLIAGWLCLSTAAVALATGRR